jgi:hypothetical protein
MTCHPAKRQTVFPVVTFRDRHAYLATSAGDLGPSAESEATSDPDLTKARAKATAAQFW